MSREEIDKVLKAPFFITYIKPIICIGYKGITKADTINPAKEDRE